MASCPSCGADIWHAKTGDGVNVPLEHYTEPTGNDRYTVQELGPPLVVWPVAPTFTGDAYPDHRRDCPGHDNGLVT